MIRFNYDKINCSFCSFSTFLNTYSSKSTAGKFNFLIWSFESSLALMIIITFILTVILSILIVLPLKIFKMFKKNKKEVKAEEIKHKSSN